jgi:SOS-response transcriptional repressor LexA
MVVDMSLGSRLKQAREAAGISQRELARRSGLSQQLISKLENGLVESTTEVFPFAEALGIDPRWLATGRGEMLPQTDAAGEVSVVAFLPLISWVAAGNWRELAEPGSPAEETRLIPVTCRVSASAYALKVQGDSMEPVFPNGSIIIVDPAGDARQGAYVVMRLDDAKEATFKQLIEDGGNRLLKPLNPRYPIMPIRENATLCGVVRQMVMDFD